MKKFNDVVARYNDRCDFALVYIEEAHPSDGWRTGSQNFDIAKTCTLEARLQAARVLEGKVKPACPIYVDTMSDEANRGYGALFERLYVLIDGHVAFQGGRGPENYDVGACEAWLTSHFGG